MQLITVKKIPMKCICKEKLHKSAYIASKKFLAIFLYLFVSYNLLCFLRYQNIKIKFTQTSTWTFYQCSNCLLLLLSHNAKPYDGHGGSRFKWNFNRMSTSLTNAAVDWNLLSMQRANNIGKLKIPFKPGYYITQKKLRQRTAPHNTTASKFTFHSNSECICNNLL